MTAHREWLRVGLLCLLATTAHVGSRAQAQTYPAGPVKFITQLGAGSGTDPAMRIVIDQLGKMWGQQTVLINQPGAGGALAARAAHSAAPDGHTLYMAIASTFTVLPQLQPDLPFNVNDFAPIGFVGEVPMAIAVVPTLAVNSLPELIAYSKKQSGGLNVAITGNVTGVSNLIVELGSKQLGLLRELAPGTTAIAVLTNPNFPGTERQLRDVEAAARVLGLQLMVLRASSEREMETAFATMARQSGVALLLGVDPFFVERRDHIVALAARHAIPVIYPVREFAVAGGLMSYGSDFADSYRQAGIYTGRIVRGEKPADLPVQRSTKFEFVINFKTAKGLGLAVPTSMQLLADEVIE